MTLQERLKQLADEKTLRYNGNISEVDLYQKIFQSLKGSDKDLKYEALKCKAKAWAKRKDFLAQIGDTLKRQKDLTYPDNQWTEPYLKYLKDEFNTLVANGDLKESDFPTNERIGNG